jgi:peptidoglycan/LPS O-acetylase OafA/YrhL
MKQPSIWLRVGAVLQAIGTVLHTIATSDPPSRRPGGDAVFGPMQSFHFQIMGFSRSHWDFYRGYELSITVAFGVLAVLIWQVGNLSRTEPKQAVPLIVTILVAEMLLSAIGWEYFFAGPGGMSILIAACLAIAIVMIRRCDRPALATRRAVKAG